MALKSRNRSGTDSLWCIHCLSWTQFKDDCGDTPWCNPSVSFSFDGFLQSLLKERILTNYKFDPHIVLSFFQNHSRLISMLSALYKSTGVRHMNEGWSRISLSKFPMVIREYSGKNRTTPSKGQMRFSEVSRSQNMRSRFKIKLADKWTRCFNTIRTSFSIYIKPENVRFLTDKEFVRNVVLCHDTEYPGAIFRSVSVTVALLVRTKTDSVSRILQRELYWK